MSWRDRRRAAPARKRNAGCVYCGQPATRTLVLYPAGRVACCDGCADKKMAEGRP